MEDFKLKARKFELFMCCLGNGTTVCNKSEITDYEYIDVLGLRKAAEQE